MDNCGVVEVRLPEGGLAVRNHSRPYLKLNVSSVN
jgi:hypothetical protein